MMHDVAKAAYDNAVSHGFYRQFMELMTLVSLTDEQKKFIKRLWVSSRLMLITSEAAEAMEGLRKDNYQCDPKSGGVGEELADVMIRTMETACSLGYNVDEIVRIKMEANAARAHLHGGKAL